MSEVRRHAAPRVESRVGRTVKISAALATAAGLVLANCAHDTGERSSVPPVVEIQHPVEACVEIPAVTLDAEGPYIGPDIAEVQQNFKDPALTPEQNKAFGLFNAEQLKKDGIDFEIAQASRGTWRTDGYFAESRKRAEEAGLLFGAYHFLDADNGAAQADYFYDKLAQTGGPEGVIMMVDAEFEDDDNEIGPTYKDLTDFTERLHELVPDRKIVVYTFGYFWGDENRAGHWANPPAPEGTVLNWANYVDDNKTAPVADLAADVSLAGSSSDPYPSRQVGTWEEYAFRQFTSEATYGQYQKQDRPTAYGQVTLDFNVSSLPKAELLALAGLNADGTHPSKPQAHC
jgi:hypothetical protein